MSNVLANLARVQSTTLGTGTLTLGTAVTGFNTFAAAGLTDGQTVTYCIEDYSADIPATVVGREIGVGTYSSAGPTISRTTVYSSTSAGAKINCTGRQHVFITAAKEDFDTFLTTTAAAGAYQPLDADLTAIAALTSAADKMPYSTGAGTWALTDLTSAARQLLDDADAFAMRTTLGVAIGSNVQAYDAELAAIAGLTSAADRLPYFTGSGTAALATFTTAGRNLVDDADASAQRTTLGLGTAATQNTGTSGANVPLMSTANTWSGQQKVTSTTLNAHFLSESDDATANAGPFIVIRRASASPATADAIGSFAFEGKDTAGNNTSYGQLAAQIVDPTDGSEDGSFFFNTMVAGTLATRAQVYAGFIVGSPTGGDKGAGTINATAVYDDSALLCAPVEFMKAGSVNTAMWDEFAIDERQSGSTQEEFVEIDVQLSEPEVSVTRERDGTFRKVGRWTKKATPLDAVPVLNDKGEQVDIAWVPQTIKKVTPAKTIKRRNELAHEFKAMLDSGFDPRDPKQYFAKMLADEALPGLKTKANWVPNEESNAKRTNRLVLALELQTAAFKTVYEQVEALKAEVASLKKARP